LDGDEIYGGIKRLGRRQNSQSNAQLQACLRSWSDTAVHLAGVRDEPMLYSY